MDAFERLARAQPAVLLSLLLIPSLVFSVLWPYLAVLGAVAALVFGVLLHKVRSAVVLGLAVFATLAWGARLETAPAFWPFAVEGPASGWGTVTAEAPLSRRGEAPFRLHVDEVAAGDWAGRANAEVTVWGWRERSPAVGSRWRWAGTVGSVLQWKGGALVGWSAPWWEQRAKVRAALEAALLRLGPGPGALSEALLIGAVDDLTSWEKDSFRLAGCSHVLALSGMHLSLLAVALTFVLRRRTPPWFAFLVTQVVLALFCFLAGPIPSLLRAWVMAALAGWWGLRRRAVPLRELLGQSFVVCVLLWPSLTSSLSLQLSFLAMAGLFWWGQRWDRALRPWLGRWVAAQLAASAAALVATVPLILTLFGEVRWIGLVMTPPLVALTTVNLALAALVALGTLLPGFDPAWLAPLAQGLYDATFACTGWAAGFPALGLWPVVGLGLGGLGAGAYFLYTRRHRSLSLPVSLNYDSPAALQTFLDSQGYNALKRWGQNFLINAGARKQILDALDLTPGEPVWEVGPGLGALTHHLVAAGHPLTVFEIDPGYAAFLRDEFGSASAGFHIVQGDVVKTWKSQPLTGVKTVGNLPYNAASAIVADFIEGGFFPSVFVVTVQLEMAQRMTASPGSKNYSSFSVLCQSVFQLNDVVTLRPGSFYPAPEVTSRVVRLKPHSLYPGLDHGRFSRFVRECFSSRRKTLRNNLPGAASALHVSDAALKTAFDEAGVDLGLRAETLTVARFVQVYQKLDGAAG